MELSENNYYVYILSNKYNNVIYTGMTDNLCRRIEHKLKINDGFTKKYNVDKLVYFDIYNSLPEAFEREIKLKASSRSKKLKLVNEFNASWHDLFSELCN